MNELTVLMTVYKENRNVLINAIESIRNQTYCEFDFLIILDNPQNKEAIDLLTYYCKIDKRIRFFVNALNLGLPLSLNKGIKMIETKYIARMDSDDISLPDRLQRQLEYLEKNDAVDLVGTNIIYMDANGNDLYRRGGIPTEHNQIKKAMRYINVFNHPTIMGKTEIFRNIKYRNLQYAQDYDFLCRIIENNGCVANIPEGLLRYRQAEYTDQNKKISQRITSYCIQNAYREGNLSSTNIELEVCKKMEAVDTEKFSIDMNEYDKAFEYIRNKKFMQAVIVLVKLGVNSIYQRREIINLFTYGILKEKYHF